MKQGKAEDNQTQCWWCGRPIVEHGMDDTGKLNIGLKCDIDKVDRKKQDRSKAEEELKRLFGVR